MQTTIYPMDELHSIQYQSDIDMETINRNKLQDSIEDEKEAERKRLRKISILIAGSSFVFLIGFFIVVNSGTIVLSGRYQETDLKLFYQKLEFTLRYQALGLLFVVSVISFIATRRFFTSAMDPTSNNEGAVQKYKNILQNSLEQFVLSSLVQLVLTTNLSAASVMTVIPFMSITFFIGRIIYFATYPNYRVFGFLVTFLPNVVATLYCAINVSI